MNTETLLYILYFLHSIIVRDGYEAEESPLPNGPQVHGMQDRTRGTVSRAGLVCALALKQKNTMIKIWMLAPQDASQSALVTSDTM